MAKIVLHLKQGDATPDLKGWHLRLYRQIREMCAADGIGCDIRTRDKDLTVSTRQVRDRRFQDGNLHIIDDRSIAAPGVLNAGVAYLWEYWHLDAVGTKAFSSIGAQTFDPSEISRERAQTFFGNLKKRYVQRRRSKYKQPSDEAVLPDGSVSVFLQGTYPVNAGATRFSDMDMLLAVLAQAGDRPIVVKPHPLANDATDVARVQEIAHGDARVVLTEANVHDILRTSAATVSINSTVALEGFMHRVPAILFGISDFHHVATTVTRAEDFGAALAAEVSRDQGYEAYLAWYFLKHCLPLNSGKLHDKIWQRFAEVGFARERFR